MGVLSTIQSQIKDRLTADPHFSDIPVITEDRGDINTAINTAIGQIGTCVIVLTPSADVRNANVPGPYFDRVGILVRTFETPTINRASTGTGKKAIDTAEIAVALLHQYSPVGEGGDIVATSPAIRIGNDPKRLTYDSMFQCAAAVFYDIDTLPVPVINVDGTITCSEPGVAIFYNRAYAMTGSRADPIPRTSTLYTGTPIDTSGGTTVKAKAFLVGWNSSPVAERTW